MKSMKTKKTKNTLEICCPSGRSIRFAYGAGADRVELCSALSVDGLTPSAAMIESAVEYKDGAQMDGRSWTVNVLIRPREGNFVYTEDEIDIMRRDIKIAKKMGADGVVIGALTEDGDVDIETMNMLMREAKGMSVTFHRAFDHGRNPKKMLEDIISLGCDRLLTSGCAPTALEGKETIKELVKQAKGRIKIMAGAGVKPENVKEIMDYTGVDEVHGSAGGSLKTMEELRQQVG